MNEFVNIRVAKNGYIVDRCYWPKDSAFMVNESLVAKTIAEAVKIVQETLKAASSR